MSLLMDALRRAEQAKRQAEGGPAGMEMDLELTPEEPSPAPAAKPAAEMPQAEPAISLAPDLQRRLEMLDDEFGGGSRREPASAKAERAAAAEAERAAARNMLAVNAQPSRRNFYIALGSLTALAALAIGGYVWWEIQPKSGIAAAPGSAATVAARPARTPAAETPARSTAPAAAPITGTAGPATGKLERESVAPRSSTAIAPAADPGPRSTTRVRLSSEPPPAPAVSAAASIPIRSGGARPVMNPDVARAYDSYGGGDLAAARSGYERALRTEPKNGDALLGLAAISLREGQPGAADGYFARALEADPTSAPALAGLLALRGSPDPARSESRLKSLLTAQPDAHAAHFALGNLYAEQARWSEAQQSYFRAFSADPGNPDYLFNLAVSLDELRQPRAALQYYQQALAAAEKRPETFARNQVSDRIRALQQ